uniref:Beta-galactosidase C-terminal domain n=1 Tax=Actinotalea sp. C106 TaxID=2908644 RepID=UPI00202986D8
ALLGRVAREAGARSLPGAGAEVEVVRRRGAEQSYLFVINHGTGEVEVPVAGFELTQAVRTEALRVPAGAVRVIREEAS